MPIKDSNSICWVYKVMLLRMLISLDILGGFGPQPRNCPLRSRMDGFAHNNHCRHLLLLRMHNYI
jgi:hypothetical protein